MFETNYIIYPKKYFFKENVFMKTNAWSFGILKKNLDMKMSKFIIYSINMCKIFPCITLIKII